MLQVHFQLRHLLGVGKRIPKSVLKEVAQHTGLREHQVRDMLYENKKGISFDSLGKIIYFLVHHKGHDRRTILNELFVTTPESFWSMLAYRSRIELCVGAREDPRYFNQYVVIASDAELQASLVSSITGMRYAFDGASAGDGENEESAEEDLADALFYEDAAGGLPVRTRILNPLLVPAPPKGLSIDSQVRSVAEEVFQAFAAESKDRALVCLGSVKSNPVIEPLIAHCFAEAQPFESQDSVASPGERAVPFMLRYRENRDPQPASCCGGIALAKGWPADEPGIYYECADGHWECAPHSEEQDAALVFYRYEVATGRLDSVLGGFSSNATRALAAFVRKGAARLWPPSFKSEKLVVGAFILQFRFRRSPSLQPTNPLDFFPPCDEDIAVVRLDESVIARRLAKTWYQPDTVAGRHEEEESAVPVSVALGAGERRRRGSGRRTPPPSQPR